MNVNFNSYSDADCVVTEIIPDVSIGNEKLKMHVRAENDDATVWAEMTREAGEIVVGDAVTYGTPVTVTISYKKLLKVPAGKYVHSLIMPSDDDEQRIELWRGTMTHASGPTRWTVPPS